MRETKGKAKWRHCRYCKGEFRPRHGSGGKPQYFCSEAHRKAFWKSGSLPYDKLLLRVEKRVQEAVDQQLAFWHDELSRLQAKIRVIETGLHVEQRRPPLP